MREPTETAKLIVHQVKQIDEQIAALQNTRTLLRDTLLSELELGGPEAQAVDIEGYRARWHPEIKASKERGKLDRNLLVRAGVTPDQLDAGTKPGGAKKGYMEVRKIGADDADDA
jgi:hypothetical protein